MFQQHSFLTKPNLSFAAHRAARAILLFGALVVPLLLHANVGVPLSKRGGIDIDGSNKSVLLARSTSVAGTPQLVAGRLVNGQFQFSVLADPGGNFRLVGVTDLDGNGKSDLLFQNVAQGESGDVTSWLNFESNNATALRRVKQVWDVQAVGDLDGDGRGDVVWRYLGFDPARPGDTGGGAPLSWKLLGAADLNGDGMADMVYVSPDNAIRVLMATASRTCANYSAGSIPAGFVAQAFADFSGNGRGDILIRNPSTGQTAFISLSATGVTLPPFTGSPDDVNASCTSTTTTLPSATTNLPTTDTTWQLYATGDYNGDGVFDVVWLRPDGVLSLWQMNRNIAIPTLISNAGNAPSVANNFGVFHGVTAPIAPAPSSFARIQQKVFAPSCNSCHTAGNAFATQSGLVLDETVAYRNLRNASVKNSMAVVHGMKQVVPRDLENSLLYQKLLLWDPTRPQHFGSPMPLGSTSLTVGQLEFIKRWIEAGAPETGDNIDAKLLDDRTLPAYAPFVPLSPPAKGYQLTIEPFSVQPDFERELFVLRDVKNPAPIYVSRIETRMRTNSHHFLLYTFQSNTPSFIMPPVDMVRDIRNPDGNLNFVNTLPLKWHAR